MLFRSGGGLSLGPQNFSFRGVDHFAALEFSQCGSETVGIALEPRRVWSRDSDRIILYLKRKLRGQDGTAGAGTGADFKQLIAVNASGTGLFLFPTAT